MLFLFLNSLCQCLLIDVFRLFIFNVIINVLGLVSHIIFCWPFLPLFLPSFLPSSFFSPLLSCNLSILIYLQYLECIIIVFLVVALGITIYIYNLSSPTSIDILTLKMKCSKILPFRCLYFHSPFRNIIVLIISFTYLNTITNDAIMFASVIKYDLQKSLEGWPIIFSTPLFLFQVLFFLTFQAFLYHFASVQRMSFSHS